MKEKKKNKRIKEKERKKRANVQDFVHFCAFTG
jgi:hypothetical protein